MPKDRRDRSQRVTGFDVVIVEDGTAEGLEVKDVSRFLHNSEARFAPAVVLEIANNYPAEHIVGKLVDGVYVVGDLKEDAVVRTAILTILEEFDKPVTLDLGTTAEPKKFADGVLLNQTRGTIEIVDDCTTFIERGRGAIIATIGGTDDGLAGRVAVTLDVIQLGASTLYPSS